MVLLKDSRKQNQRQTLIVDSLRKLFNFQRLKDFLETHFSWEKEMSLNLTNLFTVLGKSIKQVNTMNGYFAALEMAKDDIYTVEAAQSLQDDYAPLVGVYQGYYDALSGWIQQMIAHTQSILTDEELVLDELPIFSSDIQTVLDALIDNMYTNNGSVKASIVTLGGSDANTKAFTIARFDALGYGGTNEFPNPSVFLSRLLDGVTPPTNRSRANIRYNNVESQMAMSCTLRAKCLTGNPGAETLQIFSDSPFQASYTFDNEAPGNGPVLVNAESGNIIPANYDFSSWSGNNPATGWTVTGGAAGTDWVDASGSGVGPLQINTAGTYVKQKITGLSRLKAYGFAAYCIYSGSTGTATAKMRIENVDGVTVHKDFGSFSVSDVDPSGKVNNLFLYGFYSPDASVNLDDIYVTIEHDAESDSATHLLIYKVVAVELQYFNGLGMFFWNPYISLSSVINQDTDPGVAELPVGSTGSIAIVNGNQGVIQTYFRKSFNVQLPTDDSGSETIADTLAT